MSVTRDTGAFGLIERCCYKKYYIYYSFIYKKSKLRYSEIHWTLAKKIKSMDSMRDQDFRVFPRAICICFCNEYTTLCINFLLWYSNRHSNSQTVFLTESDNRHLQYICDTMWVYLISQMLWRPWDIKS